MFFWKEELSGTFRKEELCFFGSKKKNREENRGAMEKKGISNGTRTVASLGFSQLHHVECSTSGPLSDVSSSEGIRKLIIQYKLKLSAKC